MTRVTEGRQRESHVLVVCTGNICRSPLLERILQSALDDRWGSGAVSVRSAGTMGLQGSAMDERARAQLGLFGGDGAGFVARRLTPAMVAGADLVLTATREHRALVAQAHPRALRYAFTYRDFADLSAHLEEADLPTAADGPTWVREITATVAACRGRRATLPPADADVVDPYGRQDHVYETMSSQIRTATPSVVRALTGR